MKVYDGKGPMKIATFFSGGASSGKAIMDSLGHREKYQTVCAVTNNEEEASAVKMYIDAGIPVIGKNPDRYEKGKSGREHFYQLICDSISEFSPDVLAFSGWTGPKSIVSDPLFTKYKNRAFNVHPAYLGIVYHEPPEEMISYERIDIGDMPPGIAEKFMEENELTRKFVGQDVVSAAALTGEPSTASTVFALKRGCDDGPCVIRSPDFFFDSAKVAGLIKQMELMKLCEYARKEHQEKQKWKCDGPVFVKVMELAAEGRLDVDIDTMKVRIDGELLPYGGRILE